MNFQYNEPNTFDYFNKIMNECDDYQSAVEIPQFYIYLKDDDGLHYWETLWSCDFNKINDKESIDTIMSYLKGKETEKWIDDEEERWESIELYFDDCRDTNNGLENIAQLVDLVEVRKKRKECAIKYLRQVLPKYIRHYLYQPKAVMAEKARKEFLNELENGTQVSSESDKAEDSVSDDEEGGSFMLSFDDYIYLLEECVSPKQLKKIKKAYIKKELNDECFEIEWGLDLNEEEQKEQDKLEPYECGIKVRFEEDLVIKEFTHYITYNGSSAFAMWLCGVMN